MRDIFERGASWLDVLDVSPLVPGMSNRVELQQLELRIKEDVGHLEEVCRRPRTHLRVEVERMPVSRARRFPAQAANYLAAHTEDWERPTLRSVIPKRILAAVREDQFDIYENRVAVRLVDNLVAYLRRRIQEVSRLLRIFEEAAGNQGSAAVGSHWRQERIYRLWGKALDAGEVKRKAERTLATLKHQLLTVSGLKDSALYREVPRRAVVGTSLTMTNILSDDTHYRRVAELWLDWARHGLEHSVRPRQHFEEMQDLCRSFSEFGMLLTLRAFAQLQFEPSQIDLPLAANETELHRGSCTVRVSLSSHDGIIYLDGPGVEGLRIIPLCSSLSLLDEALLTQLLDEADARAPDGTTTLILYPSPSHPNAFEGLPEGLQRRLRSLSHEVSSSGNRRVGFIPVSPWDIGSVERVARQIRWSTTSRMFLTYPPELRRRELPAVNFSLPWLSTDEGSVRVLRPPLAHESIDVQQLIKHATENLGHLETERDRLSQLKKESERKKIDDLNRKKQMAANHEREKELTAEIRQKDGEIKALRDFENDLLGALALVSDLSECPTCGRQADGRRDFRSGGGKRFSCQCTDCSTTWGNVACGKCGDWIPMIEISGSAWQAHAGPSGWVDQIIGSDVLASPSIADAKIGFICPSCGESSG